MKGGSLSICIVRATEKKVLMPTWRLQLHPAKDDLLPLASIGQVTTWFEAALHEVYPGDEFRSGRERVRTKIIKTILYE